MIELLKSSKQTDKPDDFVVGGISDLRIVLVYYYPTFSYSLIRNIVNISNLKRLRAGRDTKKDVLKYLEEMNLKYLWENFLSN